MRIGGARGEGVREVGVFCFETFEGFDFDGAAADGTVGVDGDGVEGAGAEGGIVEGGFEDEVGFEGFVGDDVEGFGRGIAPGRSDEGFEFFPRKIHGECLVGVLGWLAVVSL